MRKVWQIFVRDLKRLAKNPVAIVITIGVAIIPSLYAWFNILANWDPYENTSTVPIAVTIEDKGDDVSDMGYTNAGDMIREQLEENDQLGWQFVDDESQAIEGVKSGEYYAAFVVPEDFTSSLADVLEGNTDKAHIAYYVNEKANAIAPKVTDTGATTVENQIANQFVELVGEVVVEKLQGFTGTAADAVDATRDSVATDLRDAADDLGGLSGDLGSATGALDGARSAIATARSSLGSIASTTDGIADDLQTSLTGLSDTRSKASGLAVQLNTALNTGATSVAGISAETNSSIGKVTGELGWAQGQLDGAINNLDAVSSSTLADAKTSLERLEQSVEGLDASAPGRDELIKNIDDAINRVNEAIEFTDAKMGSLKSASADIKAANDNVQGLADGANDAIQASASALTGLSGTLMGTTMPQLSGALDGFATLGGQLAGGVRSISPMLTQADASLGQLDALIEQASGNLADAAGSVQNLANKVSGIASDVEAVQSAETLAGISDVLDLDAEGVGEFLGSPAELVSQPVFPVENYGSGVAPFYTNLALWVGGFVLVAIYKLEVDDEGIGDFKPWQGFFGRWLLLNLIGQLQAIICCVGDVLLGIQCLYPVAFVFAGMVESFVYVFFVYALAIAFKHIGKALGVLLVVLQIPGASGTYPIEMQPGFFKALKPWLPFTYGINAMREAIAGFYGSYYAQNLLMLLVFLIPALLIGVTARKHLLNINYLFDRKLAETDMMIAERTGMKRHFPIATLVQTIMDSKASREAVLAGAASFELKYPIYVRRGFAALIAVPLVLLALMFVTPHKFVMLVLWICSLVVICTFLIVVEYLHTRVAERTSLADMAPEELYAMLDDELKGDLTRFSPLASGAHELADNLGKKHPLPLIARGPQEPTDTPDDAPKGGDE